MSLQIREGFPSQRQVVLPGEVIRRGLKAIGNGAVLPSDIGLYPRAKWHYVSRTSPIPQMVILCCTAGSGWIKILGQVHEVSTGKIAILPEGLPHEYGSNSDAWTIYWLHCAGDPLGMIRELLPWSVANPVVEVPDITFFASGVEEILSIYERSFGQRDLVQASLLLHGWLGRLSMLAGSRFADALSTENRVDQVIESMRQNLARNVTLDELAELAGMSASQFSAVFKKRTGYSPVDFQIRLRLARAAWLLDTTSLSVKQIASELGYGDPLYFSRRFARVYQISPSGYREIKKG